MAQIIPRDLIKHLEWSPGNEPPRETSESRVGGVSRNEIQSTDEFWSIPGVQYRGGIHTVDLMKKLLDNESAKTQVDWAAHYESAIERNEFHAPDYPLLYGLVKTLCTRREDTTNATQVIEAQKFLKDSSRAKWLMTLTRLQYHPTEEDIITHNFGTRNSYAEQINFVGPDELIKDTAQPIPCQRLLGTDDSVQEINKVFQWLNGTNTYLWRFNSKPKNVEERVAGFGADSDGAGLICVRDPTLSYSSLGVFACAEGTAQKFGGSV